MKIYDKDNIEIYDIDVDSKTKLKQSLEGADMITAVFTHKDYIDLVIGDNIVWREERYTLFDEPSVKKEKSNQYTYNIDFHAPKFQFRKVLMLLDDKTEYFVYGNLEDLLNHVITNLNRVFGTNSISLGSVPDTEYKNFHFENIDGLSCVNDIVSVFEKEWSLESGVVNIYDHLGTDVNLTFQFKRGLKTIERKKLRENELVTKLYALGSDRNITVDYGIEKDGEFINFSRLRIDPIEAPTIGQYGIIEKTKIWNDIYPRRTGTVTAVRSSGTTPHFYFTDDSMDFNINDNLIGIPAKITFNTGDLQGYEFEIINYNDVTKEYYLQEYSDETGLALPNLTFKPSVNDVYIIHDIKLPQVYIGNAENELLSKATKFMEYASYPTVVYDIKPDITYLRQQLLTLSIGDTVIVRDSTLGINIETRITDLTQSLAEQYEYTFKVGNKTKEGFVRQISSKTSVIDRKINTEINNVNVKINHIKTSNIVVNPETPQEQGMVGNNLLKNETKGLNYVISGLKIYPNYSDNNNHVYFDSCTFNHFTIDNEVKEWNIPSVLRVMINSNVKHFIYLRCEKEADIGEFFVSEDVYITDSNSGEYFFLIGVLGATINGSRVLNAIFVGGGDTSITNVTNITQGGADTAEVIKQKYESNEDTNEFTDAEKTKLANMNQSAVVMNIPFQTAFRIKGENNIEDFTEKNDVVLMRMTNGQMYWLLYNTGDALQLSSYRILSETELNLFA